MSTLEEDISNWLSPIMKDDAVGSQSERYLSEAHDANSKANGFVESAALAAGKSDYQTAGDLSMIAQQQFLEAKDWLESAARSGSVPGGTDILAQAVQATDAATAAVGRAEAYYRQLLDVPLYDTNAPVEDLNADGTVAEPAEEK